MLNKLNQLHEGYFWKSKSQISTICTLGGEVTRWMMLHEGHRLHKGYRVHEGYRLDERL